MEKPKLCINCTNYVEGEFAVFAKCKKLIKVNLVNGSEEMGLCGYLRMAGGDCGPEGIHFERNIFHIDTVI